MSTITDQDAFGRWLQERIDAWREIGIEYERNRIIRLLEADKTDREPHCSTDGCKECPAYEDGFNDAIALIKGETK